MVGTLYIIIIKIVYSVSFRKYNIHQPPAIQKIHENGLERYQTRKKSSTKIVSNHCHCQHVTPLMSKIYRVRNLHILLLAIFWPRTITVLKNALSRKRTNLRHALFLYHWWTIWPVHLSTRTSKIRIRDIFNL